MTARRIGLLILGCLVAVAAVLPPVDRAADAHLAIHMLQHTLLLAVAPALLVLGEPIRIAFELLPPRRVRALARWLRSRPLAALLNPAIALALFWAVVLVTHVPAVFDAAMESDPLHALEHGSYLFAGIVFWSAALGADPSARRLSLIGISALLTAAMVPMIAVGVALDTASGVFYASYAAGAGTAAALAEQNPAATVMWAGDVPFMAALFLAGWASLRREERLQQLREMAAAGEPRFEGEAAELARVPHGGRA